MEKIMIIIFLMGGLFSYSQNTGIETGTGTLGNLSLGKPMRVNFITNGELVGSEYLDEEFKQAKVVTTDGKTTKIKARFNTYTQEMEILQGDVKLALIPSIVQKVEFEGKVFKPISDEDTKHIFAQELVDGKLSLFKKYKAVIKEGKIVPGIQTSSPKDKIVIKELFLINKPGQKTFSLLKLNKKSILKTLNKDQSTLNFIKKNKLSYKNESDVIKVLNFFNKNG